VDCRDWEEKECRPRKSEGGEELAGKKCGAYLQPRRRKRGGKPSIRVLGVEKGKKEASCSGTAINARAQSKLRERF